MRKNAAIQAKITIILFGTRIKNIKGADKTSVL